jgi:hypothetical protein
MTQRTIIEQTEGARLDLLWEETDGGARVLRVWGTSPFLFLPDEVEAHAVTEIGAYCFAPDGRLNGTYESRADMTELCGTYLEAVTLPDTLQKIGNLSFYNCRKLSHLSIGTAMDTVGSDAFMNCTSLHRMTVRGSAKEPSGLRQILAQISSDLEVSFETREGIDAVVFFPEYYESLDEIAPAHLFGRNIEGEGFRARQCFRDGVPDLSQYDTIFQKACAEENERTLNHMVSMRLRYPIDMREEARARYESYATAHAGTICAYAIEKKDIDELSFFIRNHYVDAKTMSDCIRISAEMEWAEGTAILLRFKRELFDTQRENAYSFDDF